MISTFIVPQLGLFHSRELFITGRRLPAERALQIGFLTELAADEGLCRPRMSLLAIRVRFV